jgi:5-methylcytosine-specific restriction endonuclease McrBC regulatory subunit McrC
MDNTSLYDSNPDVVIEGGKTIIAVGDVKYKEPNATPAASDIYQLLAHTAAFGAQKCFLVYPGSEVQILHLGRAATGARLWVCHVDVNALDNSLLALVAEMHRFTE